MNTDTHLINSLNAAASFRWMHVCPIGEHPWSSADGKERIVQVIDREGCEHMARTYPLSIPNSRIDIDHESMVNDKRTAAVGWGRRAEVRDDGLWVEVEWNPEGRELVANKIYKFTSPCFPRHGLVDLGGGRMRVTRLGVIALTNDPNLRGQQPLTNRRAHAADHNTNDTNTTMDYKAMLLKALGLPAEATDEQITAACNSHASNEDAMNSRITELETQLANRDLDTHGITDRDQRALFAPLLTNAATRDTALKTIEGLRNAAPKPQPPVHNRGGRTPDTITQLSKEADADKEADVKKAAWIGNRARELSQDGRRRHQECFAQAEAEHAQQFPAR